MASCWLLTHITPSAISPSGYFPLNLLKLSDPIWLLQSHGAVLQHITWKGVPKGEIGLENRFFGSEEGLRHSSFFSQYFESISTNIPLPSLFSTTSLYAPGAQDKLNT